MNGAHNLGEGGGEVSLIADELSRAVELTHNPTVDHASRSQAYNACESFKEGSPWCAQAGLVLASSPQYSAVVKHFGLQLMETTVKYRWTQISQQEKLFIKENVMKLLWMGGWEATHLNNALARIIVEMIKREWPQQWPTLLAELSDACSCGHQHTQIVLHVFLRLVEDVATLQTLEQHQRRKDIYQALTSNMAEIFAFFMRLIELHVQQFREKTAAGDFAAATSNGRVVQVVLLTLTGFVEWVSMNHIVANNGRLLQILCILLQDEAFQLPAAECLLQIVNRKGSTKERKPLMILFSEDAISCIHRAAVASIRTVDEKNYLFLKKLSQVLAGLGQQLSTLWSAASGAEAWLPVLLETLLLMTAHASLTLATAVNSVWVAFMKHDQISRQPQLLAAVPRLLHAMSPKMIKVIVQTIFKLDHVFCTHNVLRKFVPLFNYSIGYGVLACVGFVLYLVQFQSVATEVTYPSSRPSNVTLDTTAYASIDYDSENEFTAFYCRCRTDILDCFKHCMMVAPLVTWSYVEQFTRAALDKVTTACPPDLDTHHPLYLEWEALSMVLEVVLSRVLQVEPRPSVAEGLELLDRCVLTNPASPSLLSLLLSFISALFVFLSMASCQLAGASAGSAGAELLPRVLDKIFATLVYSDGDAAGQSRSRPVKNVRRHAASLLVKLGHKYPLLLLPVFGRLHSAVRAVLARPDLTTMESVTLQEALLLVSNHLCSYERQSSLVAEVLGDCAEQWASIGPHVSSAEGLVRLVGLNEPPTEAEDEHWRARRTLMHSLTLLLGVVKRTTVPDDPDKASRGGFGGGVTASGNPVWRNPCAVHVLPLLPHVLALARSLNELHAPAAAALRHAAHARALCIPLAEQNNLLGLRDYDLPQPAPQHRMQSFLYTMHDNICHLIGAAAATLGRELYGMSGLSAALASSLLHGLHHLPDYRLKSLVRVALRPLIYHCPPAHYRDVAVPLLQHFAPFMLSHLSRRWEYVSSLYEAGKLDEESGSDQQEILEDILNRSLTREYLELLKAALVGGALNGEASAGDMEEDPPSPATQRTPETVSELGALVLVDPVAGPAALHTVLSALTWNDSTSSLRASALAGPALRAALVSEHVSAADATRALAAVLQALRTHGQHDANQAALLALAVQTYEALRPRHPSLTQVLRAIPGVDAHDVSRLDEKLFAAPSARPNKIDKSKRDLFKKITNQLIGRNVGQLFRKEVFIVDLPTMSMSKEKPLGVVDNGESTGLEGLFASPPLT